MLATHSACHSREAGEQAAAARRQRSARLRRRAEQREAVCARSPPHRACAECVAPLRGRTRRSSHSERRSTPALRSRPQPQRQPCRRSRRRQVLRRRQPPCPPPDWQLAGPSAAPALAPAGVGGAGARDPGTDRSTRRRARSAGTRRWSAAGRRTGLARVAGGGGACWRGGARVAGGRAQAEADERERWPGREFEGHSTQAGRAGRHGAQGEERRSTQGGGRGGRFRIGGGRASERRRAGKAAAGAEQGIFTRFALCARALPCIRRPASSHPPALRAPISRDDARAQKFSHCSLASIASESPDESAGMSCGKGGKPGGAARSRAAAVAAAFAGAAAPSGAAAAPAVLSALATAASRPAVSACARWARLRSSWRPSSRKRRNSWQSCCESPVKRGAHIPTSRLKTAGEMRRPLGPPVAAAAPAACAPLAPRPLAAPASPARPNPAPPRPPLLFPAARPTLSDSGARKRSVATAESTLLLRWCPRAGSVGALATARSALAPAPTAVPPASGPTASCPLPLSALAPALDAWSEAAGSSASPPDDQSAARSAPKLFASMPLLFVPAEPRSAVRSRAEPVAPSAPCAQQQQGEQSPGERLSARAVLVASLSPHRAARARAAALCRAVPAALCASQVARMEGCTAAPYRQRLQSGKLRSQSSEPMAACARGTARSTHPVVHGGRAPLTAVSVQRALLPAGAKRQRAFSCGARFSGCGVRFSGCARHARMHSTLARSQPRV